jgi:hypothetical protein
VAAWCDVGVKQQSCNSSATACLQLANLKGTIALVNMQCWIHHWMPDITIWDARNYHKAELPGAEIPSLG